MRRRTLAVLAGLTVAGAGAWFAPELLGLSGGPEVTNVSDAQVASRSDALARARLLGTLDVLDAFVAEQAAACAARPDDAEAHRVLAEAHLERCLARDTRRGMAVGKTTHDVLPKENERDIDAGLDAADRAIALGDPTADVHRIRSALVSLRVTGFASALATRPQVQAALEAAEAIDPNHPRVVVARACEKLFAPSRLLGHDPDAAKRMFLLAADALPLDERPFTFAAMCAWLLGETPEAIDLMRKAVARNPNNVYATTVLQRLEADEARPFERDV